MPNPMLASMFMNSPEQQKKMKKYKTTLCQNFEKTGTCQMAEKCHFAHGDQELRRISDPIPVHAFSLYSKPSNYGNDYAEQKPQGDIPAGYVKNNYKTIQCKFFMQDGHCSFGERWTYSHGDNDLRPLYIPANTPEYEQNGTQGHNNGDPNNQFDENGEGRLDMQDNQMYAVFNENQQQTSIEIELQLLEDTPDTKRSIFEVVNLIKSQNYEEAKKLVTGLCESSKIWFTEGDMQQDDGNHQNMTDYDDLNFNS